jgi:hypothetical protein
MVCTQIRVVNVFQDQAAMAAGHVPRQSIASPDIAMNFRRLESQQSQSGVV